MKFLLMPDSFKGTMSSQEICTIMAQAIMTHAPDSEVCSIPVADGGEGTVDSFLQAVGGERVALTVHGPYQEETAGFYGVLPNGTAVVEMAAAAGLPLVGERKNAERTTTLGVGELILDAVERGCKRIVLGLGGSATNDLGCGAAAALGVRFYDKAGDAFLPVGETLGSIAEIDIAPAKARLAGIDIVAMCDIDNPLYGEHGAAHVFGPQKGADSEMVERLDRNLRTASGVIAEKLGTDVAMIPGAGAAGGMGAGAVAFLGARLSMGIQAVLDTVQFDKRIEGVDMILTGEGKLDAQSLRGKVVIGIAERAKTYGVPVIAVVGDIGDDIEAAHEKGVSGIFSINRVAVPYTEARLRAKEDLYLTVSNLVRFIKSGALGFRT